MLQMCLAGDEICRGIADVARIVYQCARAWGPGCGPDMPSARSNVLRRHMVAELRPDGTAAFEACPASMMRIMLQWPAVLTKVSRGRGTQIAALTLQDGEVSERLDSIVYCTGASEQHCCCHSRRRMP